MGHPHELRNAISRRLRVAAASGSRSSVGPVVARATEHLANVLATPQRATVIGGALALPGL